MGQKGKKGKGQRPAGKLSTPRPKRRVRIEQVDASRWRIPKHGGMHVDGLVFASERLMSQIRDDPCLEQVENVAHLPGIVGASMAMPDIHWGYGFPIGGVAAFDCDDGVVSPGGVGYDINCGVRLLRSDLPIEVLRPRLGELVKTLYRNIPSGLGSCRGDLKLNKRDLKRVARDGAGWAVAQGYGEAGDLAHMEAAGRIPGGDLGEVSPRAIERGANQLGTLGSGNHFVEVQEVRRVFLPDVAAAFGLTEGATVVAVHTGSRGFGYQVCADSIKGMEAAARRHDIRLPDRQLCCAPLSSEPGRRYLAAMAAAANYAFANRQVIGHWVRESFAEVFGRAEPLGLRLVYDVAHNIAKMERHEVDGETRELCVHRKGATRALPPGHPELPEAYRDVGQPVFIPGDMGRRSFVLVGAPGAQRETFASCCHGAGRLLGRKAALRQTRGRSILQELADQGIVVMAAGRRTVAEEAPEAYKDVRDVVDTIQAAGIAQKVAELRPVGVIKG